jgi:hypothetical protein
MSLRPAARIPSRRVAVPVKTSRHQKCGLWDCWPNQPTYASRAQGVLSQASTDPPQLSEALQTGCRSPLRGAGRRRGFRTIMREDAGEPSRLPSGSADKQR